MSYIKSNNSKYALVLHESDEEEASFPNLGEFTYIRHVGEGGMSNILLYHLNKDGVKQEVAVKTLLPKTVSKRELTSLKTEANILSSINHDNIIRIYGITKTEFGFGLVLEYLPNGSYSYFFRNFWKIPDAAEYEDKIAPLKIRIISEVVSAMKYLHQPCKYVFFEKENRILRLDLKGDNVLLEQDLHVQICDFRLGTLSTLTKLRTGTSIHGGTGGTAGYIPPERLRNAKCKPNTKSDVYSFGILQYEILTNLPPYPDFDPSNVTILAYHVAERNFRPDVSNIASTFPNELRQLMQQCWSSLPDNRPPFSEISERMVAVQKKIDDFERKAAESVNTVMEILENEKLSLRDTISIDFLPDMEAWMESRIESENGDSYSGPANQNDVRNPGSMTSQRSETMVKTAISSAPRNLAESMDAIGTNFGDLKKICTGSVNRVRSILAEESPMASSEISLDRRSFSTGANTRCSVSSEHSCVNSSPLPNTHGGPESTVDSIDASTLSHDVVDNDPWSSSYLHSQSNTVPKEPVSAEGHRHSDFDDGRDSCSLLPHSKHFRSPRSYQSIGTTVPPCSATKLLLSIAAFVIFAAVIAIAVAIPLSQNSSHARGGSCPSVEKPNHGNVTCEKETKMSTARCHFTCDDGYQIFGTDTILCTEGKWTSGEPSCVKVCKLPKVDFGIVKCSNQTFEHSTCSISCTNHHVFQGKSNFTCMGSGKWSSPVPTCVCPSCSVGDNCQYSVRWKDIANNLQTMPGYGTISVYYGGEIFVCSTKKHSLLPQLTWTGICADKGTGTKTTCMTDYVNPAHAADAAAAQLIRNLVNGKIYTPPCDASKMPTHC